ncbi:MAG: hypothetical protein HQ567_18270, partial [Candidatus Nealsonbacteria bacterium]|nr:hypothetical protein [Candidatus Nealsonbacteria bacterium]
LGWYGVVSRRRLPRRRWPVVMVLMTVAIAVPMTILLNPTWLEQIPPPPGKPLLSIRIDSSGSMATRDMPDGISRYEVACEMAEKIKTALKDRYEIDVAYFASESTRAEPKPADFDAPEAQVTDVAAAIEDALDEDRSQGQAIILLSDGIHNAGRSKRVNAAVAKAKSMAAPVYATTLGGQTGVKDLAVSLNMPQELAFVGQQVPVQVTLTQRGSLAQRTSLSLVSEGEIVEQRDVELTADGVTEVVFEVTRKKPGLYRFEFRAEPVGDEITEVNNAASLLLRVVDQPVRVLLLEGKPYWDTKFLIRTLSQDRSVELVSVVRMAEGRLMKRTITRQRPGAEPKDESGATPAADVGDNDNEEAPLPVRTDSWSIETDASKILGTADALADYQIVVLGHNAEVYLTEEALTGLKWWLQEGDGSLVCFRGPPASQISQRLGALMPVRWSPASESRFRVQWTTAGKDLRWLPTPGGDDPLAGLPSLASVAQTADVKALTVVWAAAAGEGQQPRPVITRKPVGSGWVIVVEGAGMWRWAFLSPEYKEQEKVYGRLWRSMIRWLVSQPGRLMPSQDLALRADEVIFSTTQTPTATLLVREESLQGTARDAVPQIELSGGSLAEPEHFTPIPSGTYPGQYRVVFDRPLEEGQYRIRALGVDDEVSASAAFDVRGSLRERLEVRTRPNEMKEIAQNSGGAALKDADPEAIVRQFEGHLTRSRPQRTVQTTAWDRWWVLSAAMVLWATAWGLRRRSGLV